MAIIDAGILGGLSGKIGNVVGSSWKGISYIRIKAARRANPRTVNQVNQRNKFSAVVRLASELLYPLIRPYWNSEAVRMSGYNLFVSRNIDAYDDNGALTYPKFIQLLPDTRKDDFDFISAAISDDDSKKILCEFKNSAAKVFILAISKENDFKFVETICNSESTASIDLDFVPDSETKIFACTFDTKLEVFSTTVFNSPK